MAQAIFSSNISYSPGGGGSLTQSFNLMAPYNAINSGVHDVGDTAMGGFVNIAFGSVTGTRGLFIRNNSGTSIELFVNNPAATSGSAGGFQLHAGGILLVCATTAGGAVVGPIASLKAFMIAAPSSSGTIDYIVLGD